MSVTDIHGAWCAMINLIDTLGVIKETLTPIEVIEWKHIIDRLMALNVYDFESVADTYEISGVESLNELLDEVKEVAIDEDKRSYGSDDTVDHIIGNLEQYINYINEIIGDIKKLKEKGYRLPSDKYNEIIQNEIEKREVM